MFCINVQSEFDKFKFIRNRNFEVVGDNKMEIIAYEMRFQKDIIEQSNISCVSFEEKYFSTYMHIYNECFMKCERRLILNHIIS